MTPYRKRADVPRETTPRRSFWCGIGLHRWRFWDLGYVGHHIEHCSRQACSASRAVDL